MISAERKVSTAADLVAATKDASVSSVVVHGPLTEVLSIRLAPGQVLQGGDENATIAFAAGVDGIQLSRDNQVRNLKLETSPNQRAIFNDASVANLGQIESRSVTTTGRVQILARDKVRAGHVGVNGLDIIAADGIYIARMVPISQPGSEDANLPHVVVSNISVRYTAKTTTTINVGSVAKTFRVVNSGEVACNGRAPCSPNGKWKASIGSATLHAEAGAFFSNARVTCIAGPCPFTKIRSDGYSRGGPSIRVSVLGWSDATTFLFEAEVFHALESESIRKSYPVIFGRTFNFTVPALAEGVCIEADIDSDPIVFPLGPELLLEWASCTAYVNRDRSRAFRCDLKPGYEFE